MKKVLSLMTISLLLATAAKAAEVLKTTENGKNVLYVRGLTANTSVQLVQAGGQSTTAKLANACGVIKLTTHSGGFTSAITVNGTSLNPSTLSVLTTLPTCIGSTLTPTQTAHYKDGSGNVYLVGLTPNQAATIGLPSTGTKSAKVNGCGFAKFTESTSSPWTSSSTFTISSTSYTFGSITSQTYPPYCRNTGTSGAPLYVEYAPK